MDMTTEKPYYKVNQQLNHAVPRGKAYFSTGAAITNITPKVLQDILSIQAQFKLDIPQAKTMVGFEIYNTNKILEVPNEVMAFACRGPQSNVLINVSWAAEDVDKANLEEVRGKVKEIIEAVQGDQIKVEPSYGNYGTFPLPISCSDIYAANCQTGERLSATRRLESSTGATIENSKLSKQSTSECRVDILVMSVKADMQPASCVWKVVPYSAVGLS